MTFPETVGRYRLLAPLGQGAMGVVYRAHDPQLERDVAIKLISLRFAAGSHDVQETSSRFAREARVAARLHHPNVVSIFDAGEFGEQLFLVMELVEGETLASRLARNDFPGPAEALEIVAQAADALAAAHLAGVIHRDMKPGNMLITKRGQVKVADFGIARAMGESTELTRTGMMVGSPAYMAPEQVQGKNLDGRADLFSLGVVLYEVLLRRKPFPADTLTTLVYQILHEDPFESEAVARELRPELAEFLKWALAKESAHRIPDAVTFAARARALAAGLSASGTAPTTRMPAAPMTPTGAQLPGPSYATSAPTAILERRDRKRTWIPFAIGGALLAALAVALLLRSPAPPPDTSNGRLGERTAALPQTLSVQVPPTEAAVPVKEPEKDPADDPTAEAEKEPVQVPEKKPAPPVVAPKPAAVAPAPAPAPAPSPSNTESAPAPAAEPAPAPAAAVEAPPVSATFEGKSAAEFHVDPEEALIAIDGRVIGPSDDWDGAGGGKAYTFPGPGEYVVKVSLDGYRTQWVLVRITPSARRAVVDVEVELDETK